MKKALILLLSSMALVVALLGVLYFARYYKPQPKTEVYEATPTPIIEIIDNHVRLNEEEMGRLLYSIMDSYLNVSDVAVVLTDNKMDVTFTLDLDDVFTQRTGIQLPLTGSVDGSFQTYIENSITIIVDGGTISVLDMPVEARSVIQSALQKACMNAGVTKIEISNGKIDFYGTKLDYLVN